MTTASPATTSAPTTTAAPTTAAATTTATTGAPAVPSTSGTTAAPPTPVPTPAPLQYTVQGSFTLDASAPNVWPVVIARGEASLTTALSADIAAMLNVSAGDVTVTLSTTVTGSLSVSYTVVGSPVSAQEVTSSISSSSSSVATAFNDTINVVFQTVPASGSGSSVISVGSVDPNATSISRFVTGTMAFSGSKSHWEAVLADAAQTASLKAAFISRLEALLPKPGNVRVTNAFAASLHVDYVVSGTTLTKTEVQSVIEADVAGSGTITSTVTQFYPGPTDEVVVTGATVGVNGNTSTPVFQSSVDSELAVGGNATVWQSIIENATAVEAVKTSLAQDIAAALNIIPGALTINSITVDPVTGEVKVAMTVTGADLSAAEVRNEVNSNVSLASTATVFGDAAAASGASAETLTVRGVAAADVATVAGTRGPATAIPIAGRAGANDETQEDGLGGSEVAGAVIGAFALFALVVAIVAIAVFLIRKSKKEHQHKSANSPIDHEDNAPEDV